MAANTVVPVPSWTFPIRIAQLVISFLVLIFTVIPIAIWGSYYTFDLDIFTCLATFAIVGYWYYAYKRSPAAYNRWVVLFLDCWAVLWWLVSFSTLAELATAFTIIAGVEPSSDSQLSTTVNTCRALTGLAAFLGAVEFVLFIITLVSFAISLHRQRRSEMQPMYNGNSHLQTYPSNQMYPESSRIGPGAKEDQYVSEQPVENFTPV